MMKKLTAYSLQLIAKFKSRAFLLQATGFKLQARRGFTLIETLIAITLMIFAIIAPMSLTVRSLSSAYYARDQMTASNLAQEGIESVRSIRDGNILTISANIGSGVNIFDDIPINNWFTIDTRTNAIADSNCGNADNCPVLKTDGPSQNQGVFYGYPGAGDTAADWTNTVFKRSLKACYVNTSGSCDASASDEVRLEVIVSWKTGSFQEKRIVLYENLYRWIEDGVAI